MRFTILALLALAIFGCGSPSQEETQAYQELKPKPQTAEQKQALESITKNAPPNAAHAGVPTGH